MDTPKITVTSNTKSSISLRVINRSCGPCSACCETLEIREITKPRKSRCPDQLVGGGCGIYEKRPSVCSSFECCWVNDTFSKTFDLGDEYRPDLCGIILTAPNEIGPAGPILTAHEIREGAAESYWGNRLLVKLSKRHAIAILQYSNQMRKLIGPKDRLKKIYAALQDYSMYGRVR